MSDVPLPGLLMFPIAILIAVLVTGSATVFIQALCGPWFLFRTTPKVPLPHDAGVGSAGMAV